MTRLTEVLFIFTAATVTLASGVALVLMMIGCCRG